mmetsp:Transcript_13749/g.57456  ORF Transcript_13749/g.57456 Transcript_13749/m.57456 type:complete len:265 (+) Transcript_13749:112-906(+)
MRADASAARRRTGERAAPASSPAHVVTLALSDGGDAHVGLVDGVDAHAAEASAFEAREQLVDVGEGPPAGVLSAHSVDGWRSSSWRRGRALCGRRQRHGRRGEDAPLAQHACDLAHARGRLRPAVHRRSGVNSTKRLVREGQARHVCPHERCTTCRQRTWRTCFERTGGLFHHGRREVARAHVRPITAAHEARSEHTRPAAQVEQRCAGARDGRKLRFGQTVLTILARVACEAEDDTAVQRVQPRPPPRLERVLLCGAPARQRD